MDNVERAQSELQEIAPPTPEIEKPKSLDDVIAGLRGFGLEDFEEILTVKSGSHILQLKISNIPTSDEMLAIQAADEFKGYLWILCLCIITVESCQINLELCLIISG